MNLDAKMKRVLVAIFEDWQAEMLKNLGDGKAAKGIQVNDVLFDLDEAKAMLEKAGGPLITEATERAASARSPRSAHQSHSTSTTRASRS